MEGLVFLFLFFIIISSILSTFLGHPELIVVFLFVFLIRRLMLPRRRITRTYYFTTDDDNNDSYNTTRNDQQTTESIGHNTRVDVRPPKHGAIDVEYTEEVEEDLPE